MPMPRAGPVTRRDIKAFCVRHLAPYKVPRVVMLLLKLPRNPAGKILKIRLKEELQRKIDAYDGKA